jgi:ABC-2 type transport system permease protein
MNRSLTIAWRELRGFFLSPAGWIVPAIFLFGSGLVFMQAVFHAGHPATLRAVTGFNAIFLLIAAPAIVMGSICESRRRGTLALLQASPASSGEIVVGKWLGGLGVLLVLLVPTLLQVILLEWYGRPDLGAVASGYLGLLLLGSAVIASGLLASSLVGSQAVAFLVTCIGWVLVSVVLELGLPRLLPPTWHFMLAPTDPLQRLSDFTLGLVDTANISYFILLTAGLLVATAVVIRIGQRAAASIVGLLGVAVLIVGLNIVFLQPMFRWHVDATKSRTYSLSPRTEKMLETLEGPWRISVLLAEADADQAILRQVDEVLDQFTVASPGLVAQRIDPTRPESLVAWESILADLRAQDAAAAAQWQSAIDHGMEVFDSLIAFAQQAVGPIREASGSDRASGLAAMTVLAAQGHRITEQVREMCQPGPQRPLPEWAAARQVLQQVLSQWAAELDGLARVLHSLDATLPSAANVNSIRSEAAKLALAADRLARLTPLASSDHGRALLGGEAAIVIGPSGARVIPRSQLVPGKFTAETSGRIAFDQRFRGEQLIAAAMRSIINKAVPRVVFVHGGDDSVLAAGKPDTDVSGVASMLQAAGWTVQEWQPHVATTPAEWEVGPTAWIVLPAVRRDGIERSSSDAALLRAARALLASGEGVMLNLFPSPSAAMGQVDPWASLASELGIEPDTGAVLLREVSRPGAEMPPEAAMELNDFRAKHPVAAALHGQSLILPLAIPLQTNDEAIAIGVLPGSSDLWLEENWRPLVSADQRLRRRLPTFDDATVVGADSTLVASRELPGGGRAIVVGSGSWMRTRVADAATAAGGDRVSLVHPGNHELMMAGAAWLAGLDEQIARGALSQEVARIRSISPTARASWGWVLLAGLPLGSLLLGLLTWIRRRS